MQNWRITTGVLLAAVLGGCMGKPQPAATLNGPHAIAAEHPLVRSLARYPDQDPVGVVVASDGRVFVAFGWLDQPPVMSLAVLPQNGLAAAYPTAGWNTWDQQPGPSALHAIVSAQSLLITREAGREYLWVLDSGTPGQGPIVTAGAKLCKIDLTENTIDQVYYFDHHRDFAPDALLTDLRVDPVTRTAYLVDSRHSQLYVYDLKQRVVRGVALAQPQAEARVAPSKDAAASPALASLELSEDGRWLYHHQAGESTLYRVPTQALRDPLLDQPAVLATVERLGQIDSAIDGLVLDRKSGDLFLGAAGGQAVAIRRADGGCDIMVRDGRLQEPRAVALGPDGYLYMASGGLADETRQVATGGWVLKVSPTYLKAEATARQEAEAALAAARQAQAEAARESARVDAARRHAEQEASRAAMALREVSGAAQQITATQFALAAAERDAVDRQSEQAVKAETAAAAATAAESKAAQHALATAAAREAARVAAALATAADQAGQDVATAQAAADELAAQAERATLAHQQAQDSAAQSAAEAAAARDHAKALQILAEAQQTRAQQAITLWQQQLTGAETFVQAADATRQLAQEAEQKLQAAQMAEAQPQADPTAERLELADVPTP